MISWNPPLIVYAAILASSLSAPIAGAAPPISDSSLFDSLDANRDGHLATSEVPPEKRRLFDRLLRRGDANGDRSLSRDEFAAALTPTLPEKPIEAKQPTTFPQANAVRWLLLSMDTNRNARIEASEVPEELRRVFRAMADRIDTNQNEVIETIELSRGGRPLAQIAGRYVQQNDIDVAAVLKKFDDEQGPVANRFEAGPLRLEDLSNPEKARQAFLRLDTNNDGQVELTEVPDQLQRPVQRLLRTSDRDRDGRLSEREFVTGARRIAGRAARQAAREMPVPEVVPDEPMPANGK
jgi:Ca2+-binding EF-hand superfamily protein